MSALCSEFTYACRHRPVLQLAAVLLPDEMARAHLNNCGILDVYTNLVPSDTVQLYIIITLILEENIKNIRHPLRTPFKNMVLSYDG